MKYVEIKTDTEFVGTENYEYIMVRDDITEDELDQYAYERAVDNAEGYRYIALQGIEGDDEESEEYQQAMDDFDSYVSGTWKFITEKEYQEEVHRK